MAEFQTGKTDPGESCLKQLESLLRAYAAEEGDAAGQDRRHRQEAAGEAARRRWASAAKPLGSLGLLEQAVEQIAVLTGTEEICPEKRCWCSARTMASWRRASPRPGAMSQLLRCGR